MGFNQQNSKSSWNEREPHLGFQYETKVSNDKNLGCSGYIRDEILPSHVGIIINHYFRIPIKQPVLHGKSSGCFSSSLGCLPQFTWFAFVALSGWLDLSVKESTVLSLISFAGFPGNIKIWLQLRFLHYPGEYYINGFGNFYGWKNWS